MKKRFLIGFLSLTLLFNSVIAQRNKAYAAFIADDILIGSVLTCLSSFGIAFGFGSSDSSSVKSTVSSLLDEWNPSFNISSAAAVVSTGALYFGSDFVNQMIDFANFLVDKFSSNKVVISSGSYLPGLQNLSFTLSGVTDGGYINGQLDSVVSGTLLQAEETYVLGNGNTFKYTKSGTKSGVWYYNTSDAIIYQSNQYLDYNSILANGYKINFYSTGTNFRLLYSYQYNSSRVRTGLDQFNINSSYISSIFGTPVAVDGVSIDDLAVSLPVSNIDASDGFTVALQNIDTLIYGFARSISDIMSDVISSAADNTYSSALDNSSVYVSDSYVISPVIDITFADVDTPSLPDNPSNLGLSLKDVFPFCLPFDFYNFLSCLSADPVTPEFNVEIGDFSLHSDCHALDEYVPIFRRFIVFGYIIVLIVNTKKILRGDS